MEKIRRVIRYYLRLFHYAASADAGLFHILWNNRFEFFDRTALLLYYKVLRKKIAFTAHNVNTQERDAQDSFLNRLSLRLQYRLVDHVFVNTARMKQQLTGDFGLPDHKVTVIPFGINATIPNTALTSEEAKARLGLTGEDRVMLFFGNMEAQFLSYYIGIKFT